MSKGETRTFNVSELFISVQGESTHVGRLCCFVRLAGCNLSCAYCDTAYARKLEDGRQMSIEEIVDYVERAAVPLVEVTGGEPLVHEGTPSLCQGLLDKGFSVMVETNGSLPVSVLPEGVARIVDCKCPSSGEADRMLVENYQRLGPHDEVKFVVCDRRDYDFALEFMRRHRLAERVGSVLLSPVSDRLEPRILAEWMLKDRPPARLQLQLHKVIWGPHARGV